MTLALLLEKSTRYDGAGQPKEVIVPYAQFIEFIEEHGLNPRQPNAETLAAMSEPVESLRGYKTMEEIRETLGI